jgi:hypothetical protein
MVQKPKTFASYQSDMLTRLANSGISQLAPGAKARAFCDIFADELGAAETRDFVNLAESLIPFATGRNLDLLGEIYGVTRIPQSTASVSAGDLNFRFYVRNGTFGAINNGRDIVIPADVRITTEAQDGPVYLTDPVTLPADKSEAFFAAHALDQGSASNSSARVFSRHNFSNYAESRYGSLLVTNMYGIAGGRDEEDDDSYRTRIHWKLISPNGVNEIALRFELLQVPGLRDVVFDRRAGMFYCYVYAITPVASASVLSLVQDRIEEKAVFPITGTALNPDLVGVTLATTLTITAGASQTDREVAAAQARQAAEDYVNNLKVGEQLVINEIADRMRDASERILDVGAPNRQIEEIYIWRSRADGSRYSRSLVANYTPALGERIVVEDRAGAINLTAA